MKEKKWTMPKWMEHYRKYINNTGGNEIEDFMNCDAKNCNIVVNAPRALLCCAVNSQVRLLQELYSKGIIF